MSIISLLKRLFARKVPNPAPVANPVVVAPTPSPEEKPAPAPQLTPSSVGFSKVSQSRLATCHPDLVKVLCHARKSINFEVSCGYRGQDEQNEAVAAGFSKVKFPNSFHNVSFEMVKPEKRPRGGQIGDPCSLAADLVPIPLDWKNHDSFRKVAAVVLASAKELEIGVEWPFPTWDLPHFQLTSYRQGPLKGRA